MPICLSDDVILCWPSLHKRPLRSLWSGAFFCPTELIQQQSPGGSLMLLSPLFHTGPRSWFIPSFSLSACFCFFFLSFPTNKLRTTHNTARSEKKNETSQRRNSHTCAWNLFASLFSPQLRWRYLKNPSILSALTIASEKCWNCRCVSLRLFLFFRCIHFYFVLCIYRRCWLTVKPYGSMSFRIFPLHVPT